jgi:hypothetical protein
MEIAEGGLGVSVDVGDNTSENRWMMTRLRSKFYVEVLQLELLPSHVISEATELGSLILLALFIVESV